MFVDHIGFCRRVMLLVSLACVALTSGCRSLPSAPEADAVYVAEIQQWHKKRIESLTDQNGWLNLAGLFWLKAGENSFGTDASNDIVFPAGKAPPIIGSFVLEQGAVSVRIKPGVEVMHGDEPVSTLKLQSDAEGEPTMLTLGSLSWFIIKRGDALGVRLRDSENPRLRHFKGIETFPIDPAWRVEAMLEPYDPPKKMAVPTVLGTTLEQSSPGALVFQIHGNTYRLDPIAEPGDKQLFVIFADATNGVETYGAGRFLYVDRPGKDGKAIIDFNKAHNPPCAFSKFATCPLPPAQNRLLVKVTAGEKKYEDADH